MTINIDRNQTPKMPKPFYSLLERVLSNTHSNSSNAITINFRDPDYSADNGGYHPVEVRLEKQQDHWRPIYITDFAFRGGPFPELMKDIDICFNSKQVYSLFSGWIGEREARELIAMFCDNFIAYQKMGVYIVDIQLD
ncbi:hypothetical protein BEL05_02655 [Shewanella colwelliana]|uniref:DUF2787 domain-containing protein n=1 Tax=Shewanella colwelliana TaxID=23 RepID=A0A1E5IXG7_SHECO|nr:DUF2787 domain-containing protein [Shewanella colwelliana]OEG75174.1 hypothetical protein BEL05_02655 [Shewanella colwelliana]